MLARATPDPDVPARLQHHLLRQARLLLFAQQHAGSRRPAQLRLLPRRHHEPGRGTRLSGAPRRRHHLPLRSAVARRPELRQLVRLHAHQRLRHTRAARERPQGRHPPLRPHLHRRGLRRGRRRRGRPARVERPGTDESVRSEQGGGRDAGSLVPDELQAPGRHSAVQQCLWPAPVPRECVLLACSHLESPLSLELSSHHQDADPDPIQR